MTYELSRTFKRLWISPQTRHWRVASGGFWLLAKCFAISEFL